MSSTPGGRAWLVYAAILTIMACRQTDKGKTESTAVKDTIPKKVKVSRKIDTTTIVLLDTVIAGQAIRISRKGDTAEDYMDFSVSGKKLRIPQGAHRAAGLYYCIIDIADPKLVSNVACLKDGLLLASFDRIFRQGEMYAIRTSKDSLEALTYGNMVAIISYNGYFFVDFPRKQVVCFAPVDPDKKSTPLVVFSFGKRNFKYAGSFHVATEQYYETKESVIVKAYLRWAKRNGKNQRKA